MLIDNINNDKNIIIIIIIVVMIIVIIITSLAEVFPPNIWTIVTFM